MEQPNQQSELITMVIPGEGDPDTQGVYFKVPYACKLFSYSASYSGPTDLRPNVCYLTTKDPDGVVTVEVAPGR